MIYVNQVIHRKESMVGQFFPDRLRIETQQSLDHFLQTHEEDLPAIILAVHYFYFMKQRNRDVRRMVLDLTERIIEKNENIRRNWNQDLVLEDHRLLRERIQQEDTALRMLQVFPLEYLINYGI